MCKTQESSVLFRTLRAASLCALLHAAGADADDTVITGVAADRRPVTAPTIHVFTKDAAWYEHSLQGIERPYPASLRFLEDQGAWFTPFSRPGMTGPYDIRRWHALPIARQGLK